MAGVPRDLCTLGPIQTDSVQIESFKWTPVTPKLVIFFSERYRNIVMKRNPIATGANILRSLTNENNTKVLKDVITYLPQLTYKLAKWLHVTAHLLLICI